MTNNTTYSVVQEFHAKPYGRYPKHSDYSGQKFREEILNPLIQENEIITVDLTGYNRYGRSFIDESFGGLVLECGYSEETLRKKLIIKHDALPSIVKLAWKRISHANESINR